MSYGSDLYVSFFILLEILLFSVSRCNHPKNWKSFFIIIIVIIITFIARIIIAITNIYSSKNDLLLPKFRLFR